MSGRVWRLTNPSENGPLIILFHPGGHVVGNHWICEADGRLLTQRLGCVCVAVDYRRGPEYPFPKAVEDTHDVVKWAAGFAGEIKADTSKGFVLYGVSAGANLAAVVALLARDEKLTPQLTGVMLASPFLFTPESVPDMYKPFYNSWDQCQESPIVNRKAMLALRGMVVPSDMRILITNMEKQSITQTLGPGYSTHHFIPMAWPAYLRPIFRYAVMIRYEMMDSSMKR
jgi:acetyl esterase/lipase